MSVTNNSDNTGNLYSAGNGKVLIGQTTGQAIPGNLTQGSNVTITNGTNSITIASTGGSGSGALNAWVSFNGVGSTTINTSFNVASVTYVATGMYTVNFSSSLASANYVVSCEQSPDNAALGAGAWVVGVYSASGSGPINKTAAHVEIRTSDLIGGAHDQYNAGVICVGG